MLGIDELKQAWNVMIHPGSINKTMDIGNVFAFYYKMAIIPTIAAVIIAAIFGIAVGSLGFSLVGRLLPGIGAATVIITSLIAAGIALLYMLVLIPLNILFNAAIYQLFAKKLFSIWGKPYKYTLTAVLYGTFPPIMFIWLAFIPIVGSFTAIIFAIWGFVVLIISMARQQKISGARAFGGMLLSAVIVSIIAFVITLAVTLTFVSAGLLAPHSNLGTYCVANQGYLCSTPVYSNGNLSVTLGQDTGASWASASFAFVPTGYSVNTSTFYIVPGGMQSGTAQAMGLPIPSSAIPSHGNIIGTIYARYTLTTSQAVPTIAQVATVAVYKV